MGRDDFDDADQMRIGNDGVFMLTFFSKCVHTAEPLPTDRLHVSFTEIFIILCIFRPHLRQVEVPRLGVESEL